MTGAQDRRRAPEYIVGLDLLRFAAAILVSLSHLCGVLPGVYGVEIFFVISGIVITQSAEGRAAFDFVEGRIARLYPAAWLCTAINVAVIGAMGGAIAATHIPAAALHATVIARSLLLVGSFFVVGAYWTLPVELTFYALVALLLLGGRGRLLLPAAVAMGLASAAFVLGMAIEQRAGLGWGAVTERTWQWLPLARYGLFFATGVCLLVARTRGWPMPLCLLLLALVAAGAVEVAVRAGEQPVPAAAQQAMALAGEAIWLGGMAAMLAALALNAPLARRLPPRARGVARLAGLLTYPFYLVHQAIGGAALTVAGAAGLPPGASASLAILLAALVAWIVVRWGEPALRTALRAAIERHVRPPLAARPGFRLLFEPS